VGLWGGSSDANLVCAALGKPKQAPLPRFKGSTCRQFLSAQGIHKILIADFSALAACYLL
jgi:hypothetical protein